MKRFKGKKCAVIGGLGFIGSHLVDALIKEGAKVLVIDNLYCCDTVNKNPKASFILGDVRELWSMLYHIPYKADNVFVTAGIARTPPTIDNPIECYEVNVMGALNILEVCRKKKVKRVNLSSSNVVYAFDTPYRTSKEAVERLGDVYNKLYKQSVVSLRYSNVYGPRQLETGEAPNVFAALRLSKKENGYLSITGDGKQTRDYTHVSDIVEGNLLASLSTYKGTLDLCTGINTSLNDVAKYFKCPVKHIKDRKGDVKHIVQCAHPAESILGWTAKVKLKDGIKDVL